MDSDIYINFVSSLVHGFMKTTGVKRFLTMAELFHLPCFNSITGLSDFRGDLQGKQQFQGHIYWKIVAKQ